MKPNIYHVLTLGGALMFTACYEDKGNYEYAPIDEMTITMPEGVSALRNIDDIEFTPKVVSKLEGEIKADNSNYEYSCKINYRHLNDEGTYDMWYDIDPDRTMTVKYLATFPAGSYSVWYTVTNKNTGVSYNALGKVEVLSTTYEGWMVLSSNGPDKKARLDIVFKDAHGNWRPSTDLLGPDAPDLSEPTTLGFYPSQYSSGDILYVFSRNGGYSLDPNALTTQANRSVQETEFIQPNAVKGIPAYFNVTGLGSIAPTARFIITTEGNLYKISSVSAGSCYEHLLNNTTWGSDPAYKVAPFIGTNEYQGYNQTLALFYDETNKRFLHWNNWAAYYEASNEKTLIADKDPDNAIFSYQTGKDMVHMEGSRYAVSTVFSVLQDANGQRSIYGINVSGFMGISQASYDDNITAEHFNDAEHYAFHSISPLTLWSYGNKVYCYDRVLKQLTDVVTLDASEHITKIKFNLYKNQLSALNDQSEAFMDKQHNLIVATGNGQPDGGKIRFYQISNSGKLTLVEEYSGLGEEIVDVMYRERRK